MDDLDHLLPGGDRFGHRGAGRLGLHALDEVARHGQGDIGLQQRHAHLAQGGGHVLGLSAPCLGQPVEDAAEALGQGFEHARVLLASGAANARCRTRGRNALTDGDPRKSEGTGSTGLRELRCA
jgi:hypothetical protein